MINELKSHYIHFSLLLFVIIVLLQFNFFLFNIQSYKNTDLNKKEIEGIVVLTGDKFRILEGLKILNSEIGYKLLISGVNKEISIEEIKKDFQKLISCLIVVLNLRAFSQIPSKMLEKFFFGKRIII
jgi:hypothetical protein